MHFGTGPYQSTLTDVDPYVLDDHLAEIEVCARISKSVFFLVSTSIFDFIFAIKYVNIKLQII